MSGEDNLTLQSDEVEALSAIYGDEWCVVDEAHRIYVIEVTDGQDKPVWTACIQVHMPETYPSDSPPEYQLNAPWLRGEERRNLEGALADVYCDNIGESIVYLWVERIREFVQGKITDKHTDHESQPGRCVTMTTETEHGDDDLDFSLLVLSSGDSDTSDLSSDPGDAWECPAILHGDTVTDRRSTFQPHLAPVFHKSQVPMVMSKLYENKKIANATHNIMAYRIIRADQNRVMCQGCDDDGETHAGSRMLHLLQILDAENVVVVVSRWYGGIHLGPDRFKHINNCTRTILDANGYIHNKEEKKGPKSSEKKKR